MSEQIVRVCKTTNIHGQPCGGFPLKGSDYCAAHDPDHREAMAEARKRGGTATMRRIATKVLQASDFEAKGVKDVGNLIVETINQIRTGKIDIRIGNAVGYLANILIRALETVDLEDRMGKLEQMMEKHGEQP